MSQLRSHAAAALAVASIAACSAASAPPDARLALSIAPLELAGVQDAEYRVTVANASGETVWTRDLTASAYGSGGDVAYVGPCDADDNDNTVTVEVLGLYAGPGQTLPIDAGAWRDPGPLSRDFTCVANADVPVRFDLTLARAATQGFFDVAVSFDDVFCSAKLDCGATTDPADDLHLLHTAGGDRGPTAVLGFACTGDPNGGAESHVYLDLLRVTCGGVEDYVVVDPSGQGNVDLAAAPNVNTAGYLFGAAVYHGVEGLANKVYWNVALGLDLANAPAGSCVLHARGTASADALAGHSTPAGTSWPVIAWDVELTAGGARTCTNTAIDDGGGVATGYTALDAPETFAYHIASATGLVEAATYCGDGNIDAGEQCDDGGTAAGDGCSPTCQFEATPASFSGLVTWVHAGAGTTLVSGALATWVDQSGSGNDFVQGTASKRPVLTADANNGYPAVRFEAAQADDMSNGVNLSSGAFSVFIAARMRGPVTNRILGGANNNWLLGWWSGNQDTVYNLGWVSPSQTVRATTAWMQYGEVSTGASMSAYRAGRLMYTSTTYASGPNGLALSRYSAAEQSDADVLEVIAYDRALSDAERQAIERYLDTKYALEDPLIPPSGIADVSQWVRGDLGVTTVDDNGVPRVASWANQAGNSDGFSNTGALATKPRWIDGGLNGHPVIALTPTQWLTATTLRTPTNAAVTTPTAFIVARQTGRGQMRRILSGKASNWLIGWHNAYQERAYVNPSWIHQPFIAATYEWQQYTLAHTATAASFYKNGTLLKAFTGSGLTAPAGWTLNNDYASEYSDSEVAEIALFSRVLSGWERSEIERYLNDRYFLYGDLAACDPVCDVDHACAHAECGCAVPGPTVALTAGMLSQSGITSFTAAGMVDGVIGQSWHTDSSVAGAWVQIDLGAGNARAVTQLQVYRNASAHAGVFDIQHSDDAASWTTVARAFTLPDAGWNAVDWEPAGAHRYWRLLLTNTPGAGAWLDDIRLAVCPADVDGACPAACLGGEYCSDGLCLCGAPDPLDPATLSHSGLTAFNPSLMVNGSLADSAWHTDSAVAGAYWKLDLGAGNVQPYTRFRAYKPSSQANAGVYTLEHSDDDVTYTPVYSGFTFAKSGWNGASWALVGAHRYWRMRLTNTPGSGAWLDEVQLFACP
ncbi:MAG: hypothetical protein EP329_03915 [Deltaproteobacteria bacterium]|nr:MAG: hypothetical protein EP329_03915 [Deltaproteobacteria bacterium]